MEPPEHGVSPTDAQIDRAIAVAGWMVVQTAEQRAMAEGNIDLAFIFSSVLSDIGETAKLIMHDREHTAWSLDLRGEFE